MNKIPQFKYKQQANQPVDQEKLQIQQLIKKTELSLISNFEQRSEPCFGINQAFHERQQREIKQICLSLIENNMNTNNSSTAEIQKLQAEVYQLKQENQGLSQIIDQINVNADKNINDKLQQSMDKYFEKNFEKTLDQTLQNKAENKFQNFLNSSQSSAFLDDNLQSAFNEMQIDKDQTYREIEKLKGELQSKIDDNYVKQLLKETLCESNIFDVINEFSSLGDCLKSHQQSVETKFKELDELRDIIQKTIQTSYSNFQDYNKQINALQEEINKINKQINKQSSNKQLVKFQQVINSVTEEFQKNQNLKLQEQSDFLLAISTQLNQVTQQVQILEERRKSKREKRRLQKIALQQNSAEQDDKQVIEQNINSDNNVNQQEQNYGIIQKQQESPTRNQTVIEPIEIKLSSQNSDVLKLLQNEIHQTETLQQQQQTYQKTYQENDSGIDVNQNQQYEQEKVEQQQVESQQNQIEQQIEVTISNQIDYNKENILLSDNNNNNDVITSNNEQANHQEENTNSNEQEDQLILTQKYQQQDSEVQKLQQVNEKIDDDDQIENQSSEFLEVFNIPLQLNEQPIVTQDKIESQEEQKIIEENKQGISQQENLIENQQIAQFPETVTPQIQEKPAEIIQQVKNFEAYQQSHQQMLTSQDFLNEINQKYQDDTKIVFTKLQTDQVDQNQSLKQSKDDIQIYYQQHRMFNLVEPSQKSIQNSLSFSQFQKQQNESEISVINPLQQNFVLDIKESIQIDLTDDNNKLILTDSSKESPQTKNQTSLQEESTNIQEFKVQQQEQQQLDNQQEDQNKEKIVNEQQPVNKDLQSEDSMNNQDQDEVTYELDQDGYLLDEQGQYILDDNNQYIKLSNEHIKFLRDSHILEEEYV